MYYYSFNQYLRERFGEKVRRISLNANFTCPNKDGTISRDGCIFCNELGFAKLDNADIPLEEQITRSMASAKERFGAKKFIAYFQNASGTNASLKELKAAYDVIRKFPEIVMLSISTRPDCVDDEKLDLIAGYKDDYEVWIEYGLQTIHDKTLNLINRGHTFSQVINAVEKTAKRGIKVGAHVMLGLPGETKEDMLKTAKEINNLPISGVKLHVLHVLKNTRLEEMYLAGMVRLMDPKEYVGTVCDFLENLRDDCVILRLVSDAKEAFLVAPGWVNNKLSLITAVEEEFAARKTRQGSCSN